MVRAPRGVPVPPSELPPRCLVPLMPGPLNVAAVGPFAAASAGKASDARSAMVSTSELRILRLHRCEPYGSLWSPPNRGPDGDARLSAEREPDGPDPAAFRRSAASWQEHASVV